MREDWASDQRVHGRICKIIQKRFLTGYSLVVRVVMERIKSSYAKEDVARLVIDVLLYKEMMAS